LAPGEGFLLLIAQGDHLPAVSCSVPPSLLSIFPDRMGGASLLRYFIQLIMVSLSSVSQRTRAFLQAYLSVFLILDLLPRILEIPLPLPKPVKPPVKDPLSRSRLLFPPAYTLSSLSATNSVSNILRDCCLIFVAGNLSFFDQLLPFFARAPG